MNLLKTSIKIICLLILAHLLPISHLRADTGKTGLTFLTLGNGARALGMGEALTALAESSEAIYWNPAGLGLTPSSELLLSHVQHFEDSHHQHAALAIPVKKGKKGGFGLSITRFSIDNIESRDADSTLLGSVEHNDVSLKVAYGLRLGGKKSTSDRDGVYVGLAVKRIMETLAGVSAATFAGDVGVQYRPGQKMAEAVGTWSRRTSVGIAALNLGNGLKFDKETTELPQQVNLGMGYTHFLWGDALNLEVDLQLPRGEDPTYSGGGEFWVKNVLALRLGYVNGEDIGDGLRAGAGFRFKSIQLDYAWAGFGDELGNTHRFSFRLRFGEGAEPFKTGLKTDLIKYYTAQAEEALEVGAYNEAVLFSNQILEMDPHNPTGLHILFKAGQKINPIEPQPHPAGSETTQ